MPGSLLACGRLSTKTSDGNPFGLGMIVLPGKNFFKWMVFVSLLYAVCWIGVIDSVEAAQALNKAPFQVRGKAAILGDMDSGTVLFSQNHTELVPPASLTKVMTLYVVFEALVRGDMTLDSELPVSEKAWRTSGSKTFVRIGDRIRVEDLIRGIAVQSGNDACVVVAEHIAGSEDGFADIMNHTAQKLGMTQTHFANSTGLPAPDHMTTAQDLFLLARAIFHDFPQYIHYFQEKKYSFNGIRQFNRNRLLWRDASITGLKTGHTKDAGYCMIATSDKDGQRLAAVVMASKSSRVREEEALRLLRYGNRVFETVRLFEALAVVRNLRIWKGETDYVDGIVKDPVFVTVPRKERGTLEVGLAYHEPLVAPLEEGAPIGNVIVKLGKKEILIRPVVAKSAVPAAGTFQTMVDTVRMYLGW